MQQTGVLLTRHLGLSRLSGLPDADPCQPTLSVIPWCVDQQQTLSCYSQHRSGLLQYTLHRPDSQCLRRFLRQMTSCSCLNAFGLPGTLRASTASCAVMLTTPYLGLSSSKLRAKRRMSFSTPGSRARHSWNCPRTVVHEECHRSDPV